MDSYGFLAERYDQLTTDVGYDAWADYIQRHFDRCDREICTVVDLGCGTGSLTQRLCRRGYDMIGVDLSEDMLAVAMDKCSELEQPPLLLQQDMSRLTLMYPVDAVVCCLDSLNYVVRPKGVQRTFQRVWKYLEEGGLFLFDIRTPSMLRSMDGQIWRDETEDTYCVWQGEYAPRSRILSYYMDLFYLNEDGTWDRGEEIHQEYAYEPAELEQWLKDAGFTRIKQFGNLKMRAPKEGEDRIFFTARKETK